MTLSSGGKLGSYTITREIGRGGMGVVYLGRDTRLDREVAIKVLPDAVARDRERVLRFEREAKLMASLNHPNIGQIYGFEGEGEKNFLVLEYVQGETLAERLQRGPLPLDEALEVGKQVAGALEVAHEKGIIHRDLKPGNVMLRPDGAVKVLDFGLARAMAPDSGALSAHDSPTMTVQSPAITADFARPGVVLGTAAYMSPEQARGRAVDRRTDIWSFGVILYECLTGAMLFAGETATDSMGAIMHREPDWSALPETTPPNIRRLLRRCLAKDRQQRIRDVGDIHLEIEDAQSPDEPCEAPELVSDRGRSVLPWVLVVLMTGVAGYLIVRPDNVVTSADRSARHTRYFQLDIPNGTIPLISKPIAVSPDGALIAWVAKSDGVRRIAIDRLDGSLPATVPGTEGASLLFFSPTGEWLGFFAGNPGEDFSSLYELKKVKVNGGRPVVLCEATLPGSASWAFDGRIYFSDRLSHVVAWVPDSGGAVRRTNVEDKPRTNPPYYIDALPARNGVLVSSSNELFAVLGGADTSLSSISRGRSEGAIGSRWDAGRVRYLPTGHIAFTRRGRLLAAPLDLATLTLLAAPAPVVEGVRSCIYQETWDFSQDGMLVYLPGGVEFHGELAWADSERQLTPLPFEPAYFGTFRIAPDGKRIAIGILDVKWDIWILDLERQTRHRLTTQGDNRWPIWSPDGLRVVFLSDRRGEFELYSKRADGAGNAEHIESEAWGMPMSFSPDGRYLGFSWNAGGAKQSDIFLLSMDGDHEIQPFAQGSTAEWGSMFSPDGNYIAYTSDESGEWRVYVQPFPADGRRWTISTTSFGEEAIWSHDGGTLYYRSYDRWLAVDVRTDEDKSLYIENEREVLSGDFVNAWGISYDVAPDGRLLVVRPVGRERTDRVRVVTDWFEELNTKVPFPERN